MAAATANNPQLVTNPNPSWIEGYVAASVHIYQYTHVCWNNAGYLVPAADTASYIYAGIAVTEANNSSGSAGDITVKVIPPSMFKFVTVNAASPAQATWVGFHVFLLDDLTVGLAADSTNKVGLGRCVGIVASGASGQVLVDATERFAIATS